MKTVTALCLTALLLGLPMSGAAQDVSAVAEGNFGGEAQGGYFYQAEIYRNAEYLSLRSWIGLSPDPGALTLQLDVPRFEYTPLGGQEWLVALPEGGFAVNVLSQTEGYLYSTRITIGFIDNMFTVLSYETYNNRLAGAAPPADPFACFTADCYSCVADVWEGTAKAGDARIAVTLSFEDRNASLWTPERAIELGLCPGFQ